MRYVCLFIMLSSLPALAHKRPRYTYKQAVLVDFAMVSTGTHCSKYGNTNGTLYAANGSTNLNTTENSDCWSRTAALYTVAVGHHKYVLRPYVSPGKMAAVGVLPITSFLYKNSDLYGLLPETPVQVRTDNGGFYVKVGKRESRFTIVSEK